MPYTATSPDIALCVQLAAFLNDQLKPKEPDEVLRVNRDHHIDYDTMKGRKVLVVPLRFSTKWSARGLDRYLIRVEVLTIEKFPDAGDAVDIVPMEWMDERCDWWHTNIYKRLDFRSGPSFDSNIQTTAIDMDERYDAARLAADKMFWNRTEFEFLKDNVTP